MPLTASADAKTLRLAAGEPFVIQLAVDSVEPLSSRAFVITIYDKNREIAEKIDGVISGGLVEFVRDGSMSEALYPNQGLRVELAERMDNGRLVISTSSLTIDPSASNVDTFGSVISRTAVMITAIRTETGIPATTAAIVPYDLIIATPTGVMDFRVARNAVYAGAMI